MVRTPGAFAIDRLAQTGWLSKYALDPVIRRVTPGSHEKWTNSIVVLGKFVREEIIRHIRDNLNVFGGYLRIGVSIAASNHLGVGRDGGVNAALEDALKQTTLVGQNVSSFMPSPPSAWERILDKVPWEKVIGTLPLVALLPVLTLWNGVGLCLSWVLAYHLLAWMTMPFFDSALRKDLLFEGYLTTTSDGIKLTQTNVAQQERALYGHLDIPAPTELPWVLSAWPLIHPLLVAALVVSASIVWREVLQPPASQQAVVFAYGGNILVNIARSIGVPWKRRKQ